ncbi:MAG: bifunctional alpha,alpha-trehalose-phosphate synthase (UDP-forming)/trehalose-phosphatase [Phycisphaerales bacterium]|nr:bifunctional alpha,alpha-trehalose-phosphate synthase (UDP-forming)/trehalose-phosphatase [Phycisphaerales bacterium]
MKRQLINVSNRLPVTLGEEIKKSSGGLVSALAGLEREDLALRWIGWPGKAVEVDQQSDIERRLRQEHHCMPVFLDQSTAHGHYDGLSNSSIWPLLHYMPTYFRYQPEWWPDFVAANRLFADKVQEVAGENDLVWVHDYQLMLLPRMLRERMPNLRVGFFWHTPFPSYEVFRCHPHREDLIEGVLGADRVGFHTFGYLRHFREAVVRLLGIESEITTIRQPTHQTQLAVCPIGIDARRLEETMKGESFAGHYQKLCETYRDQKIILSVERLDYTKGILRRLNAIDRFLSKAPDVDRLKFIFVSVPSREGVEQYQELRQEVSRRIGQINGRHATLNNSPIHFIHGTVEFEQLCALYARSDVGLVTPLIDGMNLVAKEYVAAQSEPGRVGTLILSEFAGAAEELFNALVVNPYDPGAVADAIGMALAMDAREKADRMAPMRNRVMRMDARAWARAFVDDLAAIEPAVEPARKIEAAIDRVKEAMNGGGRLAMFLDYDGTLREIERQPSAAVPTAEIRELLERLAAMRKVDLTIISGRSEEDLSAFVGRLPVRLIAEHGASIRAAGGRSWERLDRNISTAWKEQILRLLQLYEQSTPGSRIENKRTSLVWHYRNADPEFGAWKAGHLASELAALLANDPVHIRHGRKIVEVTPSGIHKGSAIVHAIGEVRYELILCAGDDQTDESMFRLGLENLLSIKVGDRQTSAQYRLPTPAAFRAFLRRCIGDLSINPAD